MAAPTRADQLPTAQVELSISCTNLLDLDMISKSDPQVIVYMKDTWQQKYFEVGRTEIIDDNLNPHFVKKILLNFNFETVQKLKFEVWDIDTVGKDFIGQVETSLADIVAYKGRQFKRDLTGKVPGKRCGEIYIVVEELTSNKEVLTCQLKAYDLKKLSWFVSNDPFLLMWKSNEDNTYSAVHKTETVRGTLRPVWKEFTVEVRSICNGDYDRNIRCDVMDARLNGDHKLIGSFNTTLNRMVKGGTDQNKYQLSKTKDTKFRGFVELVSSSITQEITFLDYIKGGMEMHFAVAIDFTASNGTVTDPKSLHYIDHYQNRPTAYEVALRAVGEIISSYDTHGMFPGYGFGAKIPPRFDVSHQFPLNGDPAQPYCKGVEELVHYYKESLKVVTLYGPTNFAPIINSTAAIARSNQNGRNYFVLLIITDGIICDMPQTKYAIVAASVLPLSIIIVGVGNADFSAMDELDSDDVILQVDGNRAARDIVQFVPMNKFLGRDGSWLNSQTELAREVLYEVPGQIVGYMKMKGFRPNAPVAGGDDATAPFYLTPT